MPRLFAGFEIPTDIVERLALWRAGLPGARWIDPSNYHLTLRFIGDVDGHTAHEIDAVLAEIRPRAPISVVFEGFDVFGGERPHALIVRAKLTPELADLQAEIERRLRRAGLSPEKRKFVPHVTLARLRGVDPLSAADYIARQGQFPALRFDAGHVCLFSARDITGGGPYLVEAAYPFAGMEMAAYR
ncbi:MAG: RNA 2',3'-cyclic phosphodiesterase [Salinarimonas sp.]|nr:RNA 2',3'-cyclic phosphodiesterase [Salinarimonas sp.]